MDSMASMDSNRAGLGSHHQNGLLLTVQGQNTQGAQNSGSMPVSVGANLQHDGDQVAFIQGDERAVNPTHLWMTFLAYYYTAFEHNRPILEAFYQDGSECSYDGRNAQGAQDITQMLGFLPIRRHHVKTINCQSSGSAGGTLVMVSGTIHLNDQRALNFSQTFHLLPAAGGSLFAYYILNDIFHLNEA